MKKQSLKFEGKNLIIIAVYPFDIPHREELLKVTLEHNYSTCGERQRAVLQVYTPKALFCCCSGRLLPRDFVVPSWEPEYTKAYGSSV